jgi:hypothetical protein
MAILVKTYVENIEGKSVPLEIITSEEQLNFDRRVWEDDEGEKEDFYCPVLPGIIHLKSNDTVFWGKETEDFGYEIYELWRFFIYATFDIYQFSLENKSKIREVGGAGHGCYEIYIATSESDPKFLIIENHRLDVREEVEGHQFVMSVLTEATTFLEKLDVLLPNSGSFFKDHLLEVKSMIQKLERI